MATPLSDHFTIEELVESATAKRLGIDNTPPEYVKVNLIRLAAALERVRELGGNKPLHINSGFRCSTLNKSVGGSPQSYHLLGLAADFDPPPGMTHNDLQHAIAKSGMDFDLCMEEKARDGGHWIHLQIARAGERPRRRVVDAELGVTGGKIGRITAG